MRSIMRMNLLVVVLGSLWPIQFAQAQSPLRFGLSFSPERSEAPLDGRMLLMISNNNDREPRFQINDGANTQLIFGIDVDGLAPGDEAMIDADVLGYPL